MELSLQRQMQLTEIGKDAVGVCQLKGWQAPARGFAYEVGGLTKIYARAGRAANRDITFTIPAGEITGFLGPNGAGKTTLIRQMLGLAKPTSGVIRLFGQDVRNCPEMVRSRVSYLPQGGLSHGFWQLTAEEICVSLGMLRGLTKAEAQNQAHRRMDQLGVQKHPYSRLLGHLSGGERQRVSLASTLVGLGDVLIADEPTNGLDPEARIRVWEILRRMKNEKNVTVILVTHNVLEADKVVERVGLLDSGALLIYESIAVLKKSLSGVYIELFTEGSEAKEDSLEELNGCQEFHVQGRRMSFRCDLEDFSFLSKFLEKRRAEGRLAYWRMRSPNLEDIYFAYGGRKGLTDF